MTLHEHNISVRFQKVSNFRLARFGILSCLLGVGMCRGNMPCTYIDMVKDRGVQSLKHTARVTKCVCEEQPLASTKMEWL